jgi:hypothetical protein
MPLFAAAPGFVRIKETYGFHRIRISFEATDRPRKLLISVCFNRISLDYEMNIESKIPA